MIPAERRARIVEALEAQRVVKVATLSDALGVSEITIRRDLVILEREGLLARSYGGAVLSKRSTDDARARRRRRRKQAAEKARIAKAAAAMIEPHDTVFLGSGTTVAHLLRYVDPELEARVVTHSLASRRRDPGPAPRDRLPGRPLPPTTRTPSRAPGRST